MLKPLGVDRVPEILGTMGPRPLIPRVMNALVVHVPRNMLRLYIMPNFVTLHQTVWAQLGRSLKFGEAGPASCDGNMDGTFESSSCSTCIATLNFITLG